MRYVKIFGLPRTCTNVVEIILRKNFHNLKVLSNFPNWKHGFNTQKDRTATRTNTKPPTNALGDYLSSPELTEEDEKMEDIRYVICTKNPYNWLWSLWNFENNTKRKKPQTINYFLKNIAWHYKTDQWTPIQAFNILNKHWFTMHENYTYQAKQEDVATEDGQLELCKNIEKNFNLTRREFTFIEQRINPGLKQMDSLFKTIENNFSEKQIQYINENLDHDVVKLTNYWMLK